MILVGINLLVLCILLGMFYFALKIRNSLRTIKDSEDEYLASIAKSIQYSRDYNAMMKKQINDIKAKMLFDQFMKKAKEKDE